MRAFSLSYRTLSILKGNILNIFFAIHLKKTIFNCTKIMAHEERFELSWWIFCQSAQHFPPLFNCVDLDPQSCWIPNQSIWIWIHNTAKHEELYVISPLCCHDPKEFQNSKMIHDLISKVSCFMRGLALKFKVFFRNVRCTSDNS